MDSNVPKLGIRALTELIEASRQVSDALAEKFDAAPTKGEKAKIAREYDKELKNARAMQFLLEMHERHGLELGQEPGSGAGDRRTESRDQETEKQGSAVMDQGSGS